MIKKYLHTCKGTCSRSIELTYDDETFKIIDVDVVGGCNGNLKGIKALIKGCSLKDVYERLIDVTCGNRNTSCPMQIALAIKEALASENIDVSI